MTPEESLYRASLAEQVQTWDQKTRRWVRTFVGDVSEKFGQFVEYGRF